VSIFRLFIADAPDLVFGRSPMDCLVRYGFEMPTGPIKEVIDTLRLLSHKSEVEPKNFRQFDGPEEVFVLLQQQCYPPYYQSPFVDRASVALSLPDTRYITTKSFQIALSKGELDAESYKFRDATGNSLLHAVAGALGCSIATKISSLYRRYQLEQQNADVIGTYICIYFYNG
jgi:hypothetical protein